MKSLHLVAVFTWVASLFIIGRLFVYQSEAYENASQTVNDEVIRFNHRLRRTANFILTPSLILMLFPGLVMSYMISTGFGNTDFQLPTWIVILIILNVPLFTYSGLSMYFVHVLQKQSQFWTAKKHRVLSELMITPFLVAIIITLVYR